ncbi:MAG: flagellar hook protein FlgE [Pseudomonadota bacterium]
MSFPIALSGLNAASADLGVTANNIANANTHGFKTGRAEFGDVFGATAYGVSRNATGQGVRLQQITQQFTQGNVNYTNNSLDLAINGEGFFTVASDKGMAYTRAGAFGADRNGTVVNSAGQRLQVYPALADGSGFNTATLQDLQISSGDNAPRATSALSVQANLAATDTAPTTATFDPADPTSYNRTTSVTVYDSLGASHTANLYFVKGAAANAWDMNVTIDGVAAGPATPLSFDSNGILTTPALGEVTLPAVTLSNGAAPLSATLNLADTTQYGNSFSVSKLTQDGYTTGRLTGLEVTAEGVVQGRYSNGQATALGKVAVATFANPQGLQKLGDTAFAETYASGAALRGEAGSGSLGMMQSGALEASNVDITAQLVNMITAQRNFQANAQMIQTSDAVTQTIINIR